MSSTEQPTQREAGDETRYSDLVFHIRLPYRLFLDDGRYEVSDGERVWHLAHKTKPATALEFANPVVNFGDRAQLFLDNHGFAGNSEVLAYYPFERPRTYDEVWERQTSPADQVTLRDAIVPLNRLITWYRAMTGEFWFRPLGALDIPALNQYLKIAGQEELEAFLSRTNTEIASGYPYLKRESWYRELLAVVCTDSQPPFALELIHEGQDALERGNLRLAATDFSLAVEALFRSLLSEFFPDEDVTRAAEQMMGSYFGRYREIDDPTSLPIRKKEAQRLYAKVWAPRDELMHGHEVDLQRPGVAQARDAALKLFELWQRRPRGAPINIQGPFAVGRLTSKAVKDFPPRDPQELFARAVNRYRGGHPRDAEEAARFALGADPEHKDAAMLLGVLAIRRQDFEEAQQHFERALEIDPGFEEARHNLEHTRRQLENQGDQQS